MWRFAPQWSVFAGSAEGFGLPDAGLVLRGVAVPNQSVSSLISLQPIVTRNNEIGINWRGAQGQRGLSRYDSRSKLGSVIRITSAGVGLVERVPTVVKGWEVSGDWRPAKDWSAFGSYARLDGQTAPSQGAPLDLALGARSQGRDKAALGANWRPLAGAQLRLQATTCSTATSTSAAASAPATSRNTSRATRWSTSRPASTPLRPLRRRHRKPARQAVRGLLLAVGRGARCGQYVCGRGRTLAVTWSRMF